MLDLILPYYLWFKAAHIVSLVIWLGGQCLLVVQLSNHRQVMAQQGDAELLSMVERRSLQQVVNPAMLATLLFGTTLFLMRGPELLEEFWFQVKLTCVFAMAALHGAIAATVSSLRREIVSGARIRALQFAGVVLTITIISIAIVK